MKTAEQAYNEAIEEYHMRCYDSGEDVGLESVMIIAIKAYAREAVKADRERIIKENPVSEWKIPGFKGVQLDVEKVRNLPIELP